MDKEIKRVSTGIAGLDEILHQGFIADRTYLLRGGPGSGKTTIGLHFLMSGVSRNENTLFISLEEPIEHVRQDATARGFDLKGIHFLDLSPSSALFREVESYDIFYPSEVERTPLAKQIIEKVEEIRPQRVFIDPMTQFRYFTSDIFQFRRQVLGFLRFLVENGATVLFTSESSIEAPDADLQFMSDGVIELENNLGERTICVKKMRGSDFHGGRHTLRLYVSGVCVYPMLPHLSREQGFLGGMISSGVSEVDRLLGGGLERGTVTFLSGPSGVGKTTLGLQFLKEAAARGERSAVYSFDEEVEIILSRCDSVNIPARQMSAKGMLSLSKVDPLQYSANEFCCLVRRDVEDRGITVVMIDSIAGYSLSLRGGELKERLHALCKYLQNMGVAVFLTVENHNVVDKFQITVDGLSYLADNVIFLRYLEVEAEMRRVIGVLKKRLSNFEKTLREFQITSYGIKVGRPLKEFKGILSDRPEWPADHTSGE